MASTKNNNSATNKKIADTAKKAAKTQTKKAAKKAVNKSIKDAKKEIRQENRIQDRSVYAPKMYQRVLPYLSVLFAAILTACFITVHLVGLDSGAGKVGFAIQALFCGIFGLGAFALPLLFAYHGIRQCIFHVKWQPVKLEGDDLVEFLKARKKFRLIRIASWVLIALLSSLIAVIADQSVYDFADFWVEGTELFGGGIIGGSIGYVFIVCFENVISIIILAVLIIVCLFLSVGLTPDYVIAKLRASHIENAERRRIEREQMLEQMEREREQTPAAPVIKHRPEVRAASAQNLRKRSQMTVDDILDDDSEPAYTEPPVQKNTEKLIPLSEVIIGPAAKDDDAKPTAKQEKAPSPSPSTPTEPVRDFGGEPGFDTNEFASIDSILGSLDIPEQKSEQKTEQKPEPQNTEKAPTPARGVIEVDSLVTEEAEAELDLTKIESNELLEDMAAVAPDELAEDEPEPEIITPYVFPPFDLLKENKEAIDTDYSDELRENAKILVETLRSFKVGIKEVNYSRGPTITRYELKPEVGTRVRSIANLVDDIALNLATTGVRIEAPIPNKPAVGIEVPNKVRATVYLRDLIENNRFLESKSRLTSCLGMDVGGNPIYFDVAKMPHLLIAGTTGSGKSVCINSIIISILYKAKPEDVKLILIDPKKVEFNVYKNIPHLYCPIVSEPKKAAGALASAVTEMERRFELIEQVGVRNIADYNAITENDPDKEYLPQMVIIIDELADLMLTARDEVETNICRLAQKARAAGIHVILGTQRPSVDVITGLIKANVPSRIACTVTSQVDSRTIIDVAGAESLIGYGDMLFAPVGSAKPMRVQGAFVSDSEVEKVITFICDNNGGAKYNKDFIDQMELEAARCGQSNKKGGSASAEMDMPEVEGGDAKFRDAVKLAIEEGKISTSLMQRRLGVGYGRAAKIIDTMEQMGYVSKPDGNKPRRVLITMDEYMRRVVDGNLGEVQD